MTMGKDNQQNPQEIPTKIHPDKHNIKDKNLDPSKNNPINPQKDDPNSNPPKE